MNTTDLTRGIYRRLYSGFLTGKRINSVSIGAECLFWRMHALADDYGNLPGDMDMLTPAAFPRRKMTTTRVRGWVDELLTAGLIVRYAARGDDYLTIVGFEELQPSGKNGRRVQRFPRFGVNGDPGESEGFQGDPEKLVQSSPAQQQAQQHTHSQEHSQQQQHAEGQADAGMPVVDLRAQADLLRCLFACGLKGRAAEDLLILPGCTVERVAVLWNRIKTEQPKNPAGFMRTGIEQAWAYTPAELKKANLRQRMTGSAA